MDIFINHVVLYNSPVHELIVSKLTSFYSKIILNKPTRMIVLMPNDVNTFNADRFKFLFDEVAIVKFDPSKEAFWRTRTLASFYYFLASTSNINNQHVYFDEGKIFIMLPDIGDNTDIICLSDKQQDQELISHVVDNLVSHCNLPKTTEDFALYDFSLFYISDAARPYFQKLLRKVLKHYPEYIRPRQAYVIMSYLMACICKEYPLKNQVISSRIIDIGASPLARDFYVLI